MRDMTSNTAGTKEWMDSIRGLTLTAYVEDLDIGFVLSGADSSVADRRAWAKASLQGLERWEAEHGLGRGDVV